MKTCTRRIKLTQGQFATVDLVDYEWLNQFRWFATKRRNTYGFRWYAVRRERKTQKIIYMHRDIAKRIGLFCAGLLDHRDRNGINNTRQNIRPCTHSQNVANGTKAFGKSSRYKGVSWKKDLSIWEAYITIKNKKVHLGKFTDERDAAVAYVSAARNYYGEFACVIAS